jgi:hypothetical protein
VFRPSRRTLEPLEAQRQPVAIRAILDAARYMDAPPFSRFRASSIGPSFNASRHQHLIGIFAADRIAHRHATRGQQSADQFVSKPFALDMRCRGV